MSATDELRRLLDERGVEWEAFDDFEQTTEWSTYNGAFVYWARERDGKLLVETTTPTKCSALCTPEQVIAATLGREPDDVAMVKLHNRMNAALLEYERALGNEKADGAITVPFVAKMHHLLEEAATLGQGTCQIETTENWLPAERYHRCKECGAFFAVLDASHDIPSRYCPNCGRRIEVDDG